MNLKLSTSAVLAINSIVKTGGADSKTVLAHKVAASYEQHFDINDEDHRKRIVQHARNLQARLKKDTGDSDNLSAEASTANAKSGVISANVIGRQLPDVGILGMHAARGRSTPKDSNVHPKKRAAANLIGNMVKKSAAPDVGILGGGKGEQRRTFAGSGVNHNHIILGGQTRQFPVSYDEGNVTSPPNLYGGDGTMLTQYDNCLDTIGSSNKTIYDCACDFGAPYFCMSLSGVGQACDIQKCCQQQTDSDGKKECIESAYGSLYSPNITYNVGSYLCDGNIVGTGVPRSVAHGGMRQSVNNSSGTETQVPSCRCQEEQFSTCGPDLCNCLQNSQGDISSCLDEVNMLCEGTGTELPPTSTMDQCIGNELSSSTYCAYLPCSLGGGSFAQCTCDLFDHICSSSSDPLYEYATCKVSTCCQGQSDDAGRLSCFGDSYYLGVPYPGPYYGNYTFNGSNYTDLYAQFEECSATNSTPWCSCSILAPAYCSSLGTYFCDIQTCCQSQTDDAGRVDCVRNITYDTCISSGNYSKYDCLCEQSAVSCTLEGDQESCSVYQCCFIIVGDYDEGRKDCLGLGNSTLSTTSSTPSPIVANPSDTQVELPTNSTDSSTLNVANITETSEPKPTVDNSLDIPNPPANSSDPQINADNLLDTPSPSSAESIFVIKTSALSLIAWVVGWFFTV
jgi:hypothetical protein